MHTKIVSDGLVEQATLYCPVVWALRWDVMPFAISYALMFICTQSRNEMFVYASLIALPIMFAMHLFLFLMAQWSVKVRCWLGYRLVNDVKHAHTVRISAAQNAGADRLVKLSVNNFFSEPININILGETFRITKERLDFQKVVYNYDDERNNFVRLEYPTSASVKSFLHWRGHTTSQSVGLSLMRWGTNEYDIPIPNFLDLYLDHLVAPFFVFQVLCLFLWSLDDYWYYSVFTLLMLMFFEGMMCRQRQGSLTMLRNMRRPPVRIYVFRSGGWVSVSSDTLVPGDVISLTATIIKRSAGKRDSGMDENVNVVPCDALLVRGSCVVNEAMLTGESVPQMKETLRTRGGSGSGNSDEDRVDLGSDSHVEPHWKRHMVFSGTSLLLHTEKVDVDAGESSPIQLFPSAPDGGCVAVVVRTGFGTSQGGLMRKILFATERVTGNSSETFYFIGVLVIFAVIAAGVVLHGGLSDERRNKFRLVLHCIMIVTSVVPPELPMELSLAVTNSLAALARSLVYCTEPFRISFAGRLDTICFDKTGTLTKDQMILRGVCAPQDTNLFGSAPTSASAVEGEDEEDMMLSEMPGAVREAVIEPSSSSDLVLAIMGTCHDLMVPTAPGLAGDLVGDPLEVASMGASGYRYQRSVVGDGSTVIANDSSSIELRVCAKYPFSSDLKRMSVVVDISAPSINAQAAAVSSFTGSSSSRGGNRKSFIFCKGAPEVMIAHLATVPDYYTATYYHHMCRGRRVLALAYKPTTTDGKRSFKQPRSAVESGLLFAGFLVFDCDLKADSKSVIRELRASSHQVVMITGDSVYTAADVARRLTMLKTSDKQKSTPMALIIHVVKTTGDAQTELVWRQLGGAFTNEDERQVDDVSFNLRELHDLAADYSLCVVGQALDNLFKHDSNAYSEVLRALCPHVTIFARVSPAQKEAIILALNAAGLYTLMCGDGTNDVGALKAAHVGVSIVNNPELEQRIEGVSDGGTSSSGKGSKKAKGTSARDRMARASMELQEQEQDPTIVKLGDASIASPFTARRTSIDSVLSVMRQGRCTLVTTVQVYKVLALNCLVSAYMMSALYLRGLKQGDTQMTATGLVIAALFFFLSQAKPVPGISTQRPVSSIFAKAVLLSLLGQFLVHFTSLLAVLYICEQYVAVDDFSLSADGKFQPNVVNSAVFLLSALMQVNNFVVNYRGHPFTQSIFENIYLWRSVQVLYGLLVVVAGGQLEPLNDLLQMAPFPSPEFQAYLLGILIFNFGACYAVESVCQKLE